MPRLRAITEWVSGSYPKVSADSGGAAGLWQPDAAHMAASLTNREVALWNPVPGSPDADLLPDLSILRPRNRDLVRNNGIATGIHTTIGDSVVGSGLRLIPTPDYRALGKDKAWARDWAMTTSAAWRAYADTTECDAAGMATFGQLTRRVFNDWILNGEAIALPLWFPGRTRGSRVEYATKFQVIEADRLSTPWGTIDGPHMRGGIEIDDFGRPTAYWIRRMHPGDIYLGWIGNIYDFDRIDAETAWGRKRLIHVFDQERSAQHKGKPLLTPVLTQFKLLDHYQRTEMQAAVVNAMVAAFVETPMDSQALAELVGTDINDERFQQYLAMKNEYRVSLKGGAVIPMFPGDKLQSFAPGRPNTAFAPFVEAIARYIGAGVGLPYELVLKDWSKTNYSSARAAVLEAWRRFIYHRDVLSTLWADPAYRLWLEEAVDAGDVDAPDFYENQYAYSRCRWNGPARGWVDPVKEAAAAQLRIEAGLSTYERECAEQGLEWEEVFEQQAVERQMRQDLGLPDPAVMTSRQPLQLQQAESEDGNKETQQGQPAD